MTDLLTQNADDAVVFHERTGYQLFGEVTPDLSHFTLFNSVGNVQKVRDFWKRKFAHDAKFDEPTYIETSHLLSKAGLMENLDLLKPECDEIHIIIQKRDIFKLVWSFVNRFDFVNLGFTWAYYLDPRYPNIIISSKELMKLGPPGIAYWYVCEMFTRQEYYKILFENEAKIIFHDIDLTDITNKQGASAFMNQLGYSVTEASVKIPPKVNDTKQFFFGAPMEEQVRKIVNDWSFDPADMARKFIKEGGNLGNPKILTDDV